jgi:hypothetical protein
MSKFEDLSTGAKVITFVLALVSVVIGTLLGAGVLYLISHQAPEFSATLVNDGGVMQIFTNGGLPHLSYKAACAISLFGTYFTVAHGKNAEDTDMESVIETIFTGIAKHVGGCIVMIISIYMVSSVLHFF